MDEIMKGSLRSKSFSGKLCLPVMVSPQPSVWLAPPTAGLSCFMLNSTETGLQEIRSPMQKF